MAHALKFTGSCLLSVLLAGCATLSPKTGSQRLSHVLTTQEQADSAYRANDMQHAAALYLELTKLVPQEADYWYMLGNAYVRTQQPDEAVQAYTQAISRNPNHTRAWHNLGIVRMRQAVAAFVSSASTASAGDPLYEVSTRLANELARIGSEAMNKPASQTPAAPPLPVTVSRPTSRAAGATRSASAGGTTSITTGASSARSPGISPDVDTARSASINTSAGVNSARSASTTPTTNTSRNTGTRTISPESSDSSIAARKRPGTSAAPDQP
jgi:tetratricopeptide repeat protein